MRPLVAPVEPEFQPQLFDFDGPPMLGFPASRAVTADGSIVALPTPGHSPGHTSYLVRRREGDALLAGDAWLTAFIDEDRETAISIKL